MHIIWVGPWYAGGPYDSYKMDMDIYSTQSGVEIEKKPETKREIDYYSFMDSSNFHLGLTKPQTLAPLDSYAIPNQIIIINIRW